jgi:hypothetical protein
MGNYFSSNKPVNEVADVSGALVNNAAPPQAIAVAEEVVAAEQPVNEAEPLLTTEATPNDNVKRSLSTIPEEMSTASEAAVTASSSEPINVTEPIEKKEVIEEVPVAPTEEASAEAVAEPVEEVVAESVAEPITAPEPKKSPKHKKKKQKTH